MSAVLHIAIPPRLERQPDGTLAFATTVQDSVDQVTDCVEVILRTRQGERPLIPDFGRPDVEFEDDEETITSLLQDAVDTFEKRRDVEIDASFDAENPGVVTVSVIVDDSDGAEHERTVQLDVGGEG